ncbi:hypothetical protein [Terrihalobacillus insolitus]|uniref:hypothetical protein n=1 Tax=Terrihalobacillus insolitus TaxID=2950438 RepID=UPI002340DAE5|nr:hypothetical protein [Terrihalobacillus insolitus]MDC3414929.1 hypothetical protein [Terrihalobacillus insolitus]
MVETFVKKIKQNENLRFFTLVVSISLILIAIVLFQTKGEESIVLLGFGYVLLGTSFIYITFLEYFLYISPIYKSLLFTFLTVILTVVIYHIFSTFLYPDANVILRVSSGVITHHLTAKLILKIFFKS